MLTKAELFEFGDIYIKPLYEIAGGIAAVIVMYAAYKIVISPILRRIR